MAAESIQTERAEQFFKLYAPTQQRVFSYILTLLPNWTDAEEVFQETCMAMWKDFEQFNPDAPGSDFFRWASKVAYYRVLDFRKRQSRDSLQFSEAFVDAIADVAAEQCENLDSRIQAMRQCIGKMTDRDRELVRLRYESPSSHGLIQAYAEQINRPADTLYKALARARKSLLECIRITLAAEANS